MRPRQRDWELQEEQVETPLSFSQTNFDLHPRQTFTCLTSAAPGGFFLSFLWRFAEIVKRKQVVVKPQRAWPERRFNLEAEETSEAKSRSSSLMVAYLALMVLLKCALWNLNVQKGCKLLWRCTVNTSRVREANSEEIHFSNSVFSVVCGWTCRDLKHAVREIPLQGA